MSGKREIRATLRAIVVFDSGLSIAVFRDHPRRRRSPSRTVARRLRLLTYVCCTWLFATHAVAHWTEALDLSWDAPRGCATREAVLAEVEARKPGQTDAAPGWEV